MSPALHDFDFTAASALPANIHFGTSSWTFQGWRELIYKIHYSSDKDFKTNCLKEYSAFPWFRSVGLDSTFYAPPKRETLLRYCSQVEDDFVWVSKVWEEITVPTFPSHPRYGKKAGLENPNFLNADLFIEKVLEPYRSPEILPHCGPFVFQFQSLGPRFTRVPDRFFELLDNFLLKIPKDFKYAVEIRDYALLLPSYFKVLNKHGITHCFNHWTRMPLLVDQMKIAASSGGLAAPFYVARILSPIGVSYQESVERYSPYNQLKVELKQMREDVLRLARRAAQKNVPAFIIIGNRSEGCAPVTIDQIGRKIVESMETGT